MTPEGESGSFEAFGIPGAKVCKCIAFRWFASKVPDENWVAGLLHTNQAQSIESQIKGCSPAIQGSAFKLFSSWTATLIRTVSDS